MPLAPVCWRGNDKGIGLALIIPQVPSNKMTRESPSRVAAAPLGSKLLLRNLRVLNLGFQGKGGKRENIADPQGLACRWQDWSEWLFWVGSNGKEGCVCDEPLPLVDECTCALCLSCRSWGDMLRGRARQPPAAEVDEANDRWQCRCCRRDGVE